MKREKWLTALSAAVLSLTISYGAVGAMITGFNLNITSMPKLLFTCGFFVVFSALCFLRKRGGTVILCLLALLTGYLWRRGEAAEQILQLIFRISTLYDQAYGWGVLNLTDIPWNEGLADLPMSILGALIAIVVSRAVCRGKSAYPAVGVSLLPLLSCLVVTDTVPDAPYLFLLMTGLAVLILTSSVRRESAAQGSRLTAMTAIPVTLAMAGLFLAIPREGYVNQSKELQEKLIALVEDFPQTVENTVNEVAMNISGGELQEVDLKTLGARTQYTYAVMDVTAGESGTLYLRGQDYDVYSGTGWTASPHRAEAFTRPEGTAGDVTIRTRLRKNIFYAPYYPGDQTQLVGGKLDNGEGLREYTFARSALPENWHEIATAPEVYDAQIVLTDGLSYENRIRYLTLPNATRPGAEARVDSILTGSEYSTTEKAEAIAAYVRNCAEYDLNTGRMPSEEEDFALWFLENADTGYCVHFATAAVVLLRAADIPARYVSGYMADAEAGRTVTVTAEDAHAWAEYYEPRLDAWIVLEATPADMTEEETRPVSVIATVPDLQPSETTQPPTELETTPETRADDPVDRPAQNTGPDLSWLEELVQWLLILAAALGMAVGQRHLRLALRKRKQRRGGRNVRALARWQEAELLARLLKQQPPEQLLQFAQKAKFSQHTLTEEELGCFDDYLRACRRLLREQPWYLRLVYQYIFAAY